MLASKRIAFSLAPLRLALSETYRRGVGERLFRRRSLKGRSPSTRKARSAFSSTSREAASKSKASAARFALPPPRLHPTPSDPVPVHPVKEVALLNGEPDEEWLTENMIFRYETPYPTIF